MAFKDELLAQWQRVRAELRAECGLDKEKFSALEIFGLRMLAQQLQDKAEPQKKPAMKTKSLVRR